MTKGTVYAVETQNTVHLLLIQEQTISKWQAEQIRGHPAHHLSTEHADPSTGDDESDESLIPHCLIT